MIPMNAKHRNRNIDIRILVINMAPRALKLHTRIAQHLNLTRLVAVAILAQRFHDLVHGLAARLVIVEQVARQQHHVDVAVLRKTHHLVERLPAVIAADRVAFVVADMGVRGEEDAERVAWGGETRLALTQWKRGRREGENGGVGGTW